MPKCCQCLGGPPSYKCSCRCHRQDDLEYWETVAFVWIYDCPDGDSRTEAWKRFLMAYPEHAHHTCDDFWNRVCGSRWYHKHKHHYKKHHHHHEYGDGDDDEDDE